MDDDQDDGKDCLIVSKSNAVPLSLDPVDHEETVHVCTRMITGFRAFGVANDLVPMMFASSSATVFCITAARLSGLCEACHTVVTLGSVWWKVFNVSRPEFRVIGSPEAKKGARGEQRLCDDKFMMGRQTMLANSRQASRLEDLGMMAWVSFTIKPEKRAGGKPPRRL